MTPETIALSQTGDAAAMDAVLTHCHATITKTVARFNRPNDADDMRQAATIAIWKGIRKFNGDSKLTTWAYRVAYNACLTYIKVNRSGQHVSIDANEINVHQLADPAPTCATVYERRQLIKRHLYEIPARDRALLVLHHYDGHSIEDLQQRFSLTVGQVKGRMFQAARRARAI